MLFENASSLASGEFVFQIPVAVRVILVISACVASVLGNVVILVIFSIVVREKGKESHRRRVVDIIIASLAVAALCRGLVLGPVRATCFITGEWPLGDSMCQLQAYFEAMLRNVILWYVSLLSIERYTNHVIPHEYLVTFSPLTVNILLPGILLIVVVQVTGPLYGWGKYEFIKDIGLCAAATTSKFGCSYALYLLFSLSLPPILVILINSILLLSMVCKKAKRTEDNICGNSRMLSAQNEILSLVVLMILFVVFSIPRCIADSTIMCSGVYNLVSSATFAIYFIESLTDLLLPVLYFGMHPKSWKILYEAVRKSKSEEDNDKQEMSSYR